MKQLNCFVLCIFLIQACSAFNSSTQIISVKCNQQDTKLTLNGERLDCPAKIYVRRDKKLLVEAYKEGYAPYAQTVDYHLNKWGEYDIAGAVFILVPVFGLLFPGAWDLDQTEIEIQLVPVQQGKSD
jgi:hypothetical protein